MKKSAINHANKISVRQFLQKALSSLLIISFLSVSTPAAPETIVGTTSRAWQDIRFSFLSSQLAIDAPNWLAFFTVKKPSSDTAAEIARIQIYPAPSSPGPMRLERGQEMVFSAVAFDSANEPLSGIDFRWSAVEPGSGRAGGSILGSVYKATRLGSFVVKANASGYEAQIRVVVTPETGIRPPDTPTRSTSSRTGLGTIIGTIDTSPIKAEPEDTRTGNTKAEEKKEIQVNNLLPGEEWDNGNWTSADDPGNQTGNPPGGAADDGAGNGNFQISAPVVSLPGRGIDLALNLNYNSRVWNKAGSQVTYDIDHGYPAAGWSLGFGRLIFMGSNGGCMMLDADGTRHGYTGQISSWNTGMSFTGHTADGTFIDYGCNFTYGSNGYGWAKLPNGTTISYSTAYPGNAHVVPTRITEANGNYITITYQNRPGENIETITDTMGRVITFHYDTLGRLIEIKAPRMIGQDPIYGTATTRTLVKLHYKPLTLGYSFASGITPVVRPGTIYGIDAIYYPATNTGYWFGDTDSYSSYGMITKVVEQRGMSWAAGPDEQGTVTQGTMTKQADYNYPLTAANQPPRTNGVGLSDAPTYTELKESWDGADVAGPAITTYALDNNTYHWDGYSNSPAREVVVTQPTGVISKQYSYRTPGSWTDGLVFADLTIVMDGSTPVTAAASNVSWQQGQYDTARPSWVEATDENGHKVRTTYTYGTGKFNQITQSCDTDNSSATLRCSTAEYENDASYIGSFHSTTGQFLFGRHIFNLVKSTTTKNPDGTKASRTDYEYDNYTANPLANTPGVIQHDYTHDPYTTQTVDGDCIEWETLPGCRMASPSSPCEFCVAWQQVSAYNSTTEKRGNLTKVTSYADAPAASGSIVETRAYDMTGNMIKASSTCCEQTSILYDDPNTTDIDTQYAYPVSQTRGAVDTNSPHRITTSQVPDFKTGLIKSATDANGRTSITGYNPDTMRPDKSTSSTGAYTTFTYDEAAMTVTEEVKEANGTVAGKTKKSLNGLGQVRKTESYAPGGIIDIVETKYTQFAEEWKTSRPYRTGQTVYWSEKFYDLQRRLKKIVEPDGSTTEAFYNEATLPSGITAQPGNRIRVMDAWGRERWGRYDQQGRLIQVVEPNPDRTANPTGSIFTAGSLLTTYSYDTLGRLVQTDQGVQQRKFKYDDLGRLTRQKLAEQTATLNDSGSYIGAGQSGANWANAFFYDNRSNLTQKTDARGVKAKNIYQFWGGGDDPLNRLQRIEYDTAGPKDTSLPINSAPASNFTYMTTGDKARIQEIDTEYMVNQAYTYDVEGRVSKYTQKIKYRESYPMEVDYLYDSLDRVKEVKYPAQYGIAGNPRKIVAHTYDAASRLTGMTYGGTQQAGNVVYNAADQTTQIKIGAAGTNQVTEDYTFDPQTGLLTNQKATKNASLFIDLSYNYARNNSVGSLNGKTGHLTKITDNLNTQKNREYEFDVLGRLTKAKGGPTGTLWTQTYTFDRWGNRMTVAKTGTAAGGGAMPLDGIAALAYDNNSNRITTAGYQYDVNGNMIRSLAEDGTTWVKYEYDAANRLNIIRKDDAGQTQLERYQYDSTNARVQSHDPALDRYKTFLNAGGTTLAEFTEFTVAVPVWTKSYTYLGDSQLATITPVSGSENVEFNHPDRLGTKTVTNQSTGSSSEQAHLPFGRKLDAESTLQNNNKRFTSYDRSEKTSLDYAVNRTYDSKLGRFSQVDPIGMQAASLAAPQTLNMYSYCINDPVNFTDPSGLFIGSFFRWLGRVLLGLSRSRVARRIAIKFVVNFALSGGNFGVAIRSIIPDILQSTGIFPDPRSTVPWLPGSRLPISLGTSTLSKYIILNLVNKTKLLSAINACIKKVFSAQNLIATAIVFATKKKNGSLTLQNKTGSFTIETGVNFKMREMKAVIYASSGSGSLGSRPGGFTSHGGSGSQFEFKGVTYSNDGRRANYIANDFAGNGHPLDAFGTLLSGQLHETGHSLAQNIGALNEGGWTGRYDENGKPIPSASELGTVFQTCIFIEYRAPGSY